MKDTQYFLHFLRVKASRAIEESYALKKTVCLSDQIPTIFFQDIQERPIRP
jgi:hypothetical protein